MVHYYLICLFSHYCISWNCVYLSTSCLRAPPPLSFSSSLASLLPTVTAAQLSGRLSAGTARSEQCMTDMSEDWRVEEKWAPQVGRCHFPPGHLGRKRWPLCNDTVDDFGVWINNNQTTVVERSPVPPTPPQTSVKCLWNWLWMCLALPAFAWRCLRVIQTKTRGREKEWPTHIPRCTRQLSLENISFWTVTSCFVVPSVTERLEKLSEGTFM